MAASGPDLNLLVALRALLEEVNVTRAGARLQTGQSSMSAMLARLRAHYGDELLVQVGRGLELTPLARRLLPQVQLTLPIVERALGRGERFDPATSTRVFSFLVSDYALAEIKDALQAVAAQAPHVSFDIRPVPPTNAEIDRDLLHVDFLLADARAGVEADGAEMLRYSYALLVDSDHPALVDGALPLDAFLASPHVRIDAGRGRLTAYEARLDQLGLRPDYVVTASSILALPSIVAGTGLIAGVPAGLARHTAGARVTTAPTPFESPVTREKLLWHPSRTSDEGHGWLRRTLLEEWRRGGAASDPQAAVTTSAPL